MTSSDETTPSAPPPPGSAEARALLALVAEGKAPPHPDSREGRALAALLARPAGDRAAGDATTRHIGQVLRGLERRFAGLRATVGERRAAFHDAGGVCWPCQDSGRHGLGDDGFCTCAAGAREREDERARALTPLVAEAGVGEARFAGTTLDSWPAARAHPEIVAALDAWEAHWPALGAFLLLSAPVGRGKTGLAAVLLRRAIARTGRPGWRCKATELLTAPYERLDALVLRAQRAGALVLDDVGERQPRDLDYAQSTFFRILDARGERRAWTVITTNLSPDLDDGALSLRDYLGERVFERVMEQCRYPLDLSRVPNLRDPEALRALGKEG